MRNPFWFASHVLQCFFLEATCPLSVPQISLLFDFCPCLSLTLLGDLIYSHSLSLIILYADGTKALVQHQFSLLSSRPIDPISHLVNPAAVQLNKSKTERVIFPLLVPRPDLPEVVNSTNTTASTQVSKKEHLQVFLAPHHGTLSITAFPGSYLLPRKLSSSACPYLHCYCLCSGITSSHLHSCSSLLAAFPVSTFTPL